MLKQKQINKNHGVLRKLALGIVWVVFPVNIFAASVIEFGNPKSSGRWIYQTDPLPFSRADNTAGSPSYESHRIELNQSYGPASLRTTNAWDNTQSINQIGFTLGQFAADVFSGQGETVATVSNPYNRVDPFLFHGGISGEYEFNGLAMSSGFGKFSTFSFTRAEVESSGLERRIANAWGIATRRDWGSLNFAFTEVIRGAQSVGKVYSSSLDLGVHRIELDYLRQQNGANFRSVRYGWRNKDVRYSLELQRSENPLYSLKNENRIMFNMAFAFGPKTRMLNASEESNNTEGEEGSNTAKYLLAGGAVGAAIALSSGSSSSDDQPRFASQHASARAVLNEINPVSIAQNLEYGGYVFRNADGSFSNTKPIKGQAASLLLPAPVQAVPSSAMPRATYHTHAAFDPRFDNENFSPTDISSDISLGLDGYLGTPAGAFKYHQLSTGAIITLGSIATQ